MSLVFPWPVVLLTSPAINTIHTTASLLSIHVVIIKSIYQGCVTHSLHYAVMCMTVKEGGRGCFKVGLFLLEQYCCNMLIVIIYSSYKQQRADNEEQSGHGEQRASPARLHFGKKQLPPIPKNATPFTKPASSGTPAQSANGTHASYGPFYLEYSLLAEL